MPQSETLASYRTRTLRVLRDSTQQFFNTGGNAAGSAASYGDLDAWINQGIRWRDLWSGGSRKYKAAVALTPGLDQYNFTTLFPGETVLDMPYLWLIFGSTRYQLSERPFGEVTSRARGLVGFTNVPAMWCRYGATGLFIATAPSGSYTADFDVVTLSGTLANPGDADPLPYPYTEPVPYYAAALARGEGQRQWDEADRFREMAEQKMRDIEGARVGELPSPLSSARGRR